MGTDTLHFCVSRGSRGAPGSKHLSQEHRERTGGTQQRKKNPDPKLNPDGNPVPGLMSEHCHFYRKDGSATPFLVHSGLPPPGMQGKELLCVFLFLLPDGMVGMRFGCV